MFKREKGMRLSRRRFLASMAAMAATATSSSVAQAQPLGYDSLKSDAYLGPIDELASVTGTGPVTEGPAVDGAGNVFFSDMASSKILRWSPVTRGLSVFREASHRSNGLYFTPNGDLLCAETQTRRLTRTNMKTGEITVLADTYAGKPLAQPNDICMDSMDRVFFTSRSSVDDPTDENPKGVYRVDPDGTLDRVLEWPDVHMPNGIVFSPDFSKLYLIEAHPDAGYHRDIRVYDPTPDGQLVNGRVLVDLYPGRSGDGMCVDAEGNLYIGAGLCRQRGTSETLDTRPGIHVFSPQGKLLAFRATSVDLLTNCTFGGDDLKSLYICCGPKLLHLRTNIPGCTRYRPRT